MTVAPRFVGFEPAAEAANVVAECRDRLTLAPHQLPSFPLFLPFNFVEPLLLPLRQIFGRFTREPLLVPLAALVLLAEIARRGRGRFGGL